jgi:prolyl-tRNA synthetase
VPEKCPVPKDRLREARGIEVGHIFLLGRKYTDAMNVNVMGADGKETRVEMATFGIGVSRLVGAIIEASHDEKGIIWPEEVAPYQVGLINIRAGDEKCDAACDTLYAELEKAGLSVLYDDRKESPGSKFATMDLIGLPWQVALGPKGLEAGKAELKHRRTGEKSEVPLSEVIKKIAHV